MGRVVCLDYGRAKIGLAITDPMKIIASPIGIIKAGKNVEESAKLTIERLKEWSDIEKVVIGLPLHMSGKESQMSEEVRKFAKLLEIEFPIALFDERLSSAGAERLMSDHGLNRKKRAQLSDTLAATQLLQSFLNIG